MIQLPILRNNRFERRALSALRRHPRLKQFLKATFDYAITLPALLLLSPLLLAIAILIKLESPGPVFHRRRMLGLNGREFYAYQFRSVYVDGNARLLRNRQAWVAVLRGQPGAQDPRVTRCGRFLRQSGLNELPRLFNILQRDMSLVGPRALTRRDLMKYGRNSVEAVTSVLPGLTGLWQLESGEKNNPLNRDLEYINNWSLWLDLKILFATFTLAWKGQSV